MEPTVPSTPAVFCCPTVSTRGVAVVVYLVFPLWHLRPSCHSLPNSPCSISWRRVDKTDCDPTTRDSTSLSTGGMFLGSLRISWSMCRLQIKLFSTNLTMNLTYFSSFFPNWFSIYITSRTDYFTDAKIFASHIAWFESLCRGGTTRSNLSRNSQPIINQAEETPVAQWVVLRYPNKYSCIFSVIIYLPKSFPKIVKTIFLHVLALFYAWPLSTDIKLRLRTRCRYFFFGRNFCIIAWHNSFR